MLKLLAGASGGLGGAAAAAADNRHDAQGENEGNDDALHGKLLG